MRRLEKIYRKCWILDYLCAQTNETLVGKEDTRGLIDVYGHLSNLIPAGGEKKRKKGREGQREGKVNGSRNLV